MSQPATDSDITIAVMGATNSGKSTFIHLLTGDDNILTGHPLETQFASYTDPESGHSIQLMDMPSFDSHEMNDFGILRLILDSLATLKGQGKKLSGIIYVHSILNGTQVGGLAAMSIKVLKALCRPRRVRVVTTHWDLVDGSSYAEREDRLRAGAFRAFLEAGAQMRQHDNTATSAQTIISELIRARRDRTEEEIELERETEELWREVEALTAKLREEQKYAHAGVPLRYVMDVTSITEEWAKAGYQAAGPLGGVVGVGVGLGLGSVTGLWRAVVGK